MIPLISLARELQLARVDAIAYGAKDTGEMGGGAAAAVLAAAGPAILPALRTELSRKSLRVGEVVVTPSFNLKPMGIRWVVHIISIIKHTSEGAYCPEPQRLKDGVFAAMKSASELGARSIAFSALGTGEGRVEPRMSAQYTLDGIQRFRRQETVRELAVTFCLPSHRDYEAFGMLIQHGAV